MRKKELQEGISKMCKFAVNEISAQRFVSKFVGIDSDNLSDPKSVFKYRLPELRPLGLVGAMFRVKERLRCEVVPSLRKNFDTIADSDIANVRTMLAIDQVMFIYQHKFVNFIHSIINTIADPNTDMKVIISATRDSDNKVKIVAGKPFTRAYERHRSSLVLMDSNGDNGIPRDSNGDPSRVMGGSCTLCNVHTRPDLEKYKPLCPYKDDPDHLGGCPFHLNDPSHGILTCPLVCKVTSRAHARQGGLTDFVKYFKENPLKVYTPKNDRRQREKDKKQGKKKQGPK